MKKNREGHKWESETDSETWTEREEDTQKHLRDREMDLLVLSSFLNCPLHHGERRPFWGCDVADGHHRSCPPPPSLLSSLVPSHQTENAWLNPAQVRFQRGRSICRGQETDWYFTLCASVCIHTQNHLTDLANPLVLNSCLSRTKQKMASYGPKRTSACLIGLMLCSESNPSQRLLPSWF